MSDPSPEILDGSLTIGGTVLDCLASHIEILPDVSTVEVKVMCGTTEYPGNVKWVLKASLYQSFDPAGTEEALSAAVAGGVPVDWVVLTHRTQPVSETNPEWSGTAIPKPYPPVIGDAGDAMSIDIEWTIVGEPTKAIVPGAAALAAAPAVQAKKAEPAPAPA